MAEMTFTEAIRPHQLRRTEEDWLQVDRALDLLLYRQLLPDVVERAAIVLMSSDRCPEHECILGGKVTAGLDGVMVKCTTCRRRWAASPEDPLLNGTGKQGTCAPCFVALSRPDDQVPVLSGKVVKPAKAAEVEQ